MIKKDTLKKVAIVIAILLWAGVIFYLSSIPSSDIPQAPSIISFFVHFFEYAILGGLLGVSVFVFKKSWHKPTVLFILCLGMLYAVSDEFHQSFVPGRTVDPMDLLIDFIGLCAAIFAVSLQVHNISDSLVDSQAK